MFETRIVLSNAFMYVLVSCVCVRVSPRAGVSVSFVKKRFEDPKTSYSRKSLAAVRANWNLPGLF